ncbi:MAG: replicative DNA helicase [Synergistaceae bacterium]|nr:replicative DNA helicase [Synergistaceae bacterium]
MPVYDRIPPANLAAERSVIGSCLIDSEALADIFEILISEDFYDVNHIEMFQVIHELNRDRKPVDMISVSEELTRRGIFEKLGGQPFIAGLIDEVPTTANAAYHANIIKGHSIQRRLIEAGNHIVRLGYAAMDPYEALDEAEKTIFEVAQKRNISNIRSISEVLMGSGGTFDRVELQYKSKGADFEGFNSGFADLDHITRGFQKGSLNIIAARPSMGKTALALNIAQFGGVKTQKSQKAKAPVLIFSLEMSADQLALRMLSSGGRVNSHKMHTGVLSSNEWNQLVKAAGELGSLPIYIDDSSTLTTMDLRARCRRFKSKHNDLGLIIVDYLQLMNHYSARNYENKQQEVAEISRTLKAVARETECPILALSQLSRSVESRQEKKPLLSDLRDSGAIEQDADVVMMLYRPDYYGGEQNPNMNSEAFLNIAKNRNGPTNEITLYFDREYTLFTNAASFR